MDLVQRGIAEEAQTLQWRRDGGHWEWPYWDIDGNLLGFRRRYDGRKPYWLRHTSKEPEGEGKKMHPAARYYHAPDIRDHAQPIMYGVEGETDLLTMRALGIPSVIALFGTSGLGENLPAFLTALGVTEFRFIADNDPPRDDGRLGAGQELARKVRDALEDTAVNCLALSLADAVPVGGDLNDLYVGNQLDDIQTRHDIKALPPLLLPKYKRPAQRRKLEEPAQEIRDMIAQALGLWGTPVDSAGYYKRRIPCPIHGGEDKNAKLSATTGNIECKSVCGRTVAWTEVLETLGIVPNFQRPKYASPNDEPPPDLSEPPPDLNDLPPDLSEPPPDFEVMPDNIINMPDNDAPAPPDGVATNVFADLSPETVDGAFAVLKIDFRFDIRKEAMQVKPNDGAHWDYPDKYHLSALRSRIESECQLLQLSARGSGMLKPLRFADNRWAQYLDSALHRRRVDPFLEWLEALPQWDGMARLPILMPMLFAVEENAYTEWCGYYVPVGAIQRAYEPGCVLDETLVLQGKQRIGKSRFGEGFLPPRYVGRWFTRQLDLSADPKVKVEATRGKVICEINEMVGSTRADANEIKRFMTATDDGDVRMAYAKTTVERPRRWVMYGTTNDETSLPNDPTGLRRFAVLEVFGGGIHSTDYIPQHRDQLWAEALAAYKDGKRANLPDDLRNEVAEIAEHHRYKDESLENLIAAERWRAGQMYTTADVAFRIGVTDSANRPVDRSSASRIGRALKAQGWHKTRQKVDGRRQWGFMPPFDMQDKDSDGSADLGLL